MVPVPAPVMDTVMVAVTPPVPTTSQLMAGVWCTLRVPEALSARYEGEKVGAVELREAVAAAVTALTPVWTAESPRAISE